MSRSEHRPGVQVILFMMAAALPLSFGAWMLAVNEVPLWPGTMLVLSSALSMLIGVSFLLYNSQRVMLLLREQGNQNRRLQEANLEQERLNLELGHVTRQRRSLQHRQTDQNRAVLQLAQQFEKIANTASQKVNKTRIDPVVKSQLSFLHVICNDLVELLEVEVRHDSLHENQFVVDHELQALVARLHEENRLPETVSLQHEDADISARTDRRVFMRAVEVGLATMYPLSQGKPLWAGMISYLHAELDEVVQFTFTAFDFTLNDMDANQWFTHFQLHSSEDGRYLGPGLGMLLLKRYAELLGGEVRVSAELNDQISVYLTLPLRIHQDDEEEV